MTCAKQVVKAKLVTSCGLEFIGTNHCDNPQETCPRDAAGYASGEGYHMCANICGQKYHAEEDAILKAQGLARGSIIYLSGHTYACNPCKELADKFGVLDIVIEGDLS